MKLYFLAIGAFVAVAQPTLAQTSEEGIAKTAEKLLTSTARCAIPVSEIIDFPVASRSQTILGVGFFGLRNENFDIHQSTKELHTNQAQGKDICEIESRQIFRGKFGDLDVPSVSDNKLLLTCKTSDCISLETSITLNRAMACPAIPQTRGVTSETNVVEIVLCDNLAAEDMQLAITELIAFHTKR